MKKWVGIIALSFAIFGFISASWVPVSLAHSNISLAYSDISVQNGAIKYVLQIDMFDLRIATTPNDPDIGISTPEVLERFANNAKPEVEAYLLSKMELYGDQLPLAGHLTSLKSINKENEVQPFAEAVLSYPIRNVPKQFVLDYNLVFDSDQWHVNYVSIALGDLKQNAVIVNELRELQVGQMSAPYAIKHFFALGLEHLITGYAAILLMMTLIIGAKSLKHLLVGTAVFAAALILTLNLAALNLLTLPEHFIASAIALSILYLALNTLFNRNMKLKQHLWLTAAMGLIYGFGAAEALSGMRKDGGQVAASLFAYSGGSIVGLVLLALVLYPAIYYLRRIKRSIPVLLTTIALFGLVSFIVNSYR